MYVLRSMYSHVGVRRARRHTYLDSPAGGLPARPLSRPLAPTRPRAQQLGSAASHERPKHGSAPMRPHPVRARPNTDRLRGVVPGSWWWAARHRMVGMGASGNVAPGLGGASWQACEGDLPSTATSWMGATQACPPCRPCHAAPRHATGRRMDHAASQPSNPLRSWARGPGGLGREDARLEPLGRLRPLSLEREGRDLWTAATEAPALLVLLVLSRCC